MSAFLLSGCIFQPAEPENEAFLPLSEQYRRCGIRQTHLHVRNGSALAAGKGQTSYETGGRLPDFSESGRQPRHRHGSERFFPHYAKFRWRPILPRPVQTAFMAKYRRLRLAKNNPLELHPA